MSDCSVRGPGIKLCCGQLCLSHNHCDLQPWARAVCTFPAVPRSTQPTTLRGTVNEYQLSDWVIIINGDGGCRRAAYRRTHRPSHVARSEGRRPLGAALHSPDELNELSQWPRSWWQHYKYRPGYYYYYYRQRDTQTHTHTYTDLPGT